MQSYSAPTTMCTNDVETNTPRPSINLARLGARIQLNGESHHCENMTHHFMRVYIQRQAS